MTIHNSCHPSPRNTWESTRMKARKRSESFSVGAAIGSRRDSRWNFFKKNNVCVLWKMSSRRLWRWRCTSVRGTNSFWNGERKEVLVDSLVISMQKIILPVWFVVLVFLQKSMNLQISYPYETLSYSLMMAQSWSKDQVCMQCRSNFHEYKYGMD